MNNPFPQPSRIFNSVPLCSFNTCGSGFVPLFLEIKNEMTELLVDTLSPFIFEGIKYIYQKAREIAIKSGNENNDLQIFQTFLVEVQNWNREIIERETERIRNNKRGPSYLDDLIKAILKTYVIILSYCNTVSNEIAETFVNRITTSDFIHKCYVECSKEAHNYPYLLREYDNNIEQKRNEMIFYENVQKKIRSSIRMILPINLLLKEYMANTSFLLNGSGSDKLENIIRNDLRRTSNDRMKEVINNDGIDSLVKNSQHLSGARQKESCIIKDDILPKVLRSEKDPLPTKDVNPTKKKSIGKPVVEEKRKSEVEPIPKNVEKKDRKIKETVPEKKGSVIQISLGNNSGEKKETSIVTGEITLTQNSYEIESIERTKDDPERTIEYYIA